MTDIDTELTPEVTAQLAVSGRYLTFSLLGELYALDIGKITEIIEYRPLTVVPMMPASIRGVINLRGRVLPVIDVAERFGCGTTSVGRRTAILVVETAAASQGVSGQGIGILVDAVSKVVHLSSEDISPAPAFGAGISTDYISGMARINGDFVIVLDIDTVLALNDALSDATSLSAGLVDTKS